MSDFSIEDQRQLPAISPEEEAQLIGAPEFDEAAAKEAEANADPDDLAEAPEDPDAVPEVSDDPFELPDDLLSLIEGIDPDDLEEIEDVEEDIA